MAFNLSVIPLTGTASILIFVAALMAPDTIGDVADALFGMFANKLLLLVFVTAVAGVGRELDAGVTSGAGNLMGAIQPEIPFIGKSGSRPCAGRMTLSAAGGDGLVKLVLGLGMATGALARDAGFEQGMIKPRQFARCQWDFSVVGMARSALGFT